MLVTSDWKVLAKLRELALETLVADHNEYPVSADHLFLLPACFFGDVTISLDESSTVP